MVEKCCWSRGAGLDRRQRPALLRHRSVDRDGDENRGPTRLGRSAVAMTRISVHFEPAAFGALRFVQSEFAREMRIAAAVQWYAQGVVSQGEAAELAGLARAGFLDELRRRKVPACQATAEELADEIHGD